MENDRRLGAAESQPPRAKRGRVPFGWRNVRGDGGVFRETDPAQSAVVDQAARLRAEGASYKKIARALNAAGVRNRAGGRLRAMDAWRMTTDQSKRP